MIEKVLERSNRVLFDFEIFLTRRILYAPQNILRVQKFKNRNGNEEIGIVISQMADGEYRDIWLAKKRGTIKIMSASGTFWISPTKIEKLEE